MVNKDEIYNNAFFIARHHAERDIDPSNAGIVSKWIDTSSRAFEVLTFR